MHEARYYGYMGVHRAYIVFIWVLDISYLMENHMENIENDMLSGIIFLLM